MISQYPLPWDDPKHGDNGFIYVMDYTNAISRGKISGASSFSSNGHYTAGVAVSNQPVHSAGVVNIASGVQMSFVSSSANDTAVGTGLRTLIMSYIEQTTLLSKTESITMNGTTPVLSVATNIRFINSLTMTSAGSGATNAGDITVTNGGTTYGKILTGAKIQESSFRMVPFGKIFIPHDIVASSNSGNAAAQTVFHVINWSEAIPFWIPSNAVGCQDAPIIINLRAGRAISAGSIIGIDFTADKATQVTGSLIGHLENAT